jgi:dihydrofolate synthase/folylpolyglutamate synthase
VSAYADTIAFLQSLEVTKGWDLELERMRAALALRGHPEHGFPALHVAGTNGKGSTAAMLEAVLRASGRRTGLYTSPHLVDFAERIRAGGLAMPHDAIVALVDELRRALDAARIELTHFEFATLLAFEWFARIGLDAAVVEVGLGGRLDATNVLAPVGTAITSIAFDHEEFLGHDLASIAREKAGIAKPGVPLVVGDVPAEAEAAIAAHARAVGAPVVSAVRDAALAPGAGGLAFRSGGVAWDGLRLGLAGGFQLANARVALTLLACVRDRLPCDATAVRTGLAGARWPGRLAVVREAPRVIVDGAHNPAGVDALVRELPALVNGRRMTLVFAVMADKAWEAMLARLLPHVGRAVMTRVGRRGLDPSALVAAARGRVPSEAIADARAAVATAVAAASPDDVVLVVGSLFLAGEAYAALGADAELARPWQGWERIARQTPA